MALPFFYADVILSSENIHVLDEENSKHIVQVLRMQACEKIKLTDGQGSIYIAEITEPHKKKCSVKITETHRENKPERKVCIAVSPVKNNSRFEWFLEKATEIGVTEIIPLMCTRTEKQHFRYDRMRGILISALLQSQQAWLPVLHEPVKYKEYTESMRASDSKKFIAHCEAGNKTSLKEIAVHGTSPQNNNSTILIGPEGDFTGDEIELALQNNFIPVMLGDTRLRTETAALVAAALLCVR